MGLIINTNKHSSINYGSQIKEITQQVGDPNVDYFCFVRIFQDQTRICLTNKIDWHSHFCNERQYIQDVFEQPIEQFSSGNIFWSQIINDDIQADLYYNFNVAPTVTIIDKHNTFCDFYHYGVKAGRENSINIGNSMSKLENFTFFFKEKSEKLITTSDIISFPEWAGKDKRIIAPVANPFNIKKYIYEDDSLNTYLTQRELECVKLIAIGGKCADEIGMILDISKRTVEGHLNNLKHKFQCYKTPQLIYKIASSRLFRKILENEY